MSNSEYLKNFILSHENWEELLTKPPYSLHMQREDGLILFKYNQLDSDFTLPEVQEARGTIFEESTWKCVCRAFDKFGNYGESYVEDLDWDHGVSVQEKVDGSLMKAFFYNGRWRLATNGSINAFTTPTGDVRHETFGKLFEYALLGYESFEEFAEANLDRNNTTMFELVSPENRVVIPYDYYGIYYLGQRNMTTMEESLNRVGWERSRTGVRVPKIYNMNTLDEVIAASQELPWDQEGYVCVDKDFRRCKIKSPAYIMAHYARNNNTITKKRLLEIILSGETEEFLTYADDFREELEKVCKNTNDFKSDLESQKSKVDRSLCKKEYVSYVHKNIDRIYQDFLMRYYDNANYTAEEYTKNWDHFKWERTLEMYEKRGKN